MGGLLDMRFETLDVSAISDTPEAAANPAACPAGWMTVGGGAANEEFVALMAPGVIRAQAQLLQGARVGHQLGLPALVGLVLLHGGWWSSPTCRWLRWSGSARESAPAESR